MTKFLMICSVFLFFSAAYAQDKIMPIPKGMSHIDIDKSGDDEMIVKAWRENYNAHGFYVISFYKKDADKNLNIIPFEKNDGSFTDALHTYPEDLECQPSEVYLQSGDQNNIIFAHKEIADGYQKDNLVTFTFYRLVENEKEIPGSPSWYFIADHKKMSEKKYCDVKAAIIAEEYLN